MRADLICFKGDKNGKHILENAGHKVVGLAENGSEAISLYKTFRPDIVTMDIFMSEVDGLTALKAIKKYDPVAKVIMVTALSHEQTQEQARKLGAAGYLKKPFKTEDIVDEIKKVLAAEESI